MRDSRPILTLAHSADADDVFMWWPITGMIDPAPPFRVVAPARIDTGRFAFRALPADIQELNLRAIDRADLEITAASFFAYPFVRSRYAITACGSSFGEGYGPKIVAPAGCTMERLERGGVRIAVPGRRTSAYCALCALLGPAGFTPVEVPFDRVIGAVVEGRADAGVVIHEAQLTFAQAGLTLLRDLGAWWTQRTGLPMPLGSNLVRRDLEATHGAGTLSEIVGTLRRSIDFALAHRAESLSYAGTFSPLKSPAELDRYVSMYVNRWTVDCRPEGVRAVEALLHSGREAGLCPAVEHVDVIGDGNG